MTGKAKALCLMLGALIVLSLAVTASAQASAVLTGAQTEQLNFKFTGSNAETKCSQASFEGTAQGGIEAPVTTAELTLTPTLTSCLTAGLASQALLNGCKLTVTGGQPEPLTALVDITGCTAGKLVEVKLTGCTITVPEQASLGHIIFTNKEGTPGDVEAQMALQGIIYEFHGVACPKQTQGAASEVTKLTQDGDLTGKVTLRGYEDLGSGLINQHGHQYIKFVDGAQTGLAFSRGLFHFQDEAPPDEGGAVVTGAQTEQLNFKLTGSNAETKCSQASFEGTASENFEAPSTASELTLTPTLTGCLTAGLASQALLNGCKLTLTGGQPDPLTALVDVAGCTAGKAIEVKLTGCTITVPEQAGIGHVVFASKEGSPGDVEAQMALQGIKYEYHGAFCPKQTQGAASEVTKLTQDSDLTGKVTLLGYEDLGAASATHNSHQYGKVIDGSQTGLAFAEGQFHFQGEPFPGAVVTGEQTAAQLSFKLTASGAETKCTQASFEGTAAGSLEAPSTASDLTLTPTLTGCLTAGLASQALLNGCKLTVTGDQPEPLTALVDITGCTAGKLVEVKLTGCTITVPQQTGIDHVVFADKEGIPGDVEAQMALQGIIYEFHGIACPTPPSLTHLGQDGDLTGKVTLRGYEDLGAASATHNSHQYGKVIDGSQTGLAFADGQLHFQDEPLPGAVVTGAQTAAGQLSFKLTASNAETKCTQASFEGTAAGSLEAPSTASDLTLTPTFSGCKTAGLNSTIELHGCKLTLTGGQPDPLTALVDVAGCTAGKAIEVKLTGCTITVPEQAGIGHVVFASKEGSPGDVEAQMALQGIKYEYHGAFCPKQTQGAASEVTKLTQDSDLTGKVTLLGYEDLGAASATQHGHQYSKFIDGAQTALSFFGGQLHFQDEPSPGAVITGAQTSSNSGPEGWPSDDRRGERGGQSRDGPPWLWLQKQ